jgi:septum formation topological specificity factor MinE
MTLRDKIRKILLNIELLGSGRISPFEIENWEANKKIPDQILKEIKKEVMKAIPKIINPDKQPIIIKKIPTAQGQIVGYNLAIEKTKNNLKKLFEKEK